MSRFGQYGEAYKKMGAWELVKRVYSEMNDDGILTWAAALAYSWMFAMFPLIIFLLTLLPFIPFTDKGKMNEQINQFVAQSLPAEASKIITDNIPVILNNQSGGLLTIGALLTLWAASGGVAMTMSALNRCYDITEDQAFYIARPKAVGITLVLIILVLTVIAILPIGGIVLTYIDTHMGGLSTFATIGINLARWVLSLILLFLIVAVIYYFGPRLKGGFRYITPGGVFTVVGWILLGLAFRLYFTSLGGASSYGKTYGAVGGVVILLLFLYAASTVLLLGAEINAEFDFAMYGRTGGPDAVKPGERPGSATPEAEANAPDAPKAGEGSAGGGGASHGIGQSPQKPEEGSTPERPVHLVGPVFTAKAGLPPEKARDLVVKPVAEAPKPKAAGASWLATGAIGAAALAAGYLLHRPPAIWRPKLTSKRRLPKVYPVTYAALKYGVR